MAFAKTHTIPDRLLTAILWTSASGQLFMAIKLIALFYIPNSKCMGAQLWNSQTAFKLKTKHYTRSKYIQSNILTFLSFRGSLGIISFRHFSLVCISGYLETNISHPVTCRTKLASFLSSNYEKSFSRLFYNSQFIA